MQYLTKFVLKDLNCPNVVPCLTCKQKVGKAEVDEEHIHLATAFVETSYNQQCVAYDNLDEDIGA